MSLSEKMKKLFFLILTIISVQGYSQNILEDLQKNDASNSHIIINQDPGISTLLLARVNEIKKEHKIPGFKIHIFDDDSQFSQEKAMAVRAQFVAKYNYICEYIYEAPDSKLYIGNFRTKSEAYQALIRISHDYPKAYIKPDKIDLPDLD